MLVKKLRENIQTQNLIQAGDRIVIGISGGADSICLALVLLELRKEIPFEIYGVHLNHKIRKESAKRDAEFVREFCKEREIPFFYFERDIPEIAKRDKLSEEEAGRRERYACFELVLDEVGANKIAVAHHQNDQAETVLLHLARGTGLRGMAGMRLKTGKIIRPLLLVSRKDIEEYLAKRGISYQEDETNEELIYVRNKIRKQVIPAFLEVNSKAVKHMARSCELMGEALDFIEFVVKKEYKEQVEQTGDDYRISTKYLAKAAPFLQKELIKEMIEAAAESKKDITAANIDAVLGLLEKEVGKKVALPYQLEAEREYTSIRIGRKKEEGISPVLELPFLEGRYQIEAEGIEIFVRKKAYFGEEILKKAYTKYFDCDKIKSNVVFRYRRTGDYFVADSKGTKKLLKRFFIDEKIPREQRSRIILLAEGSHILWIVGFRISEYYKITKYTKNMFEVKLILREERKKKDAR